MASLSALTPTCVATAVQRCNGQDHATAVAKPAAGFFLGESKFFPVAQELRSCGRIRSVALPRVSAAYEPLIANPPFSKPSGGNDNSALKTELLVRFATSTPPFVFLPILACIRLQFRHFCHVLADESCSAIVAT